MEEEVEHRHHVILQDGLVERLLSQEMRQIHQQNQARVDYQFRVLLHFWLIEALEDEDEVGENSFVNFRILVEETVNKMYFFVLQILEEVVKF